MSIEKDAASDGKKTLALAGVAVIIVAGAGYVGWGWMQQSAVPDSQYNLNRVANNAPVSAQESRQYRELLKLSNQQGAQVYVRNERGTQRHVQPVWQKRHPADGHQNHHRGF